MRAQLVNDALNRIGVQQGIEKLKAPAYDPWISSEFPDVKVDIALAVDSMKDHTTDEGWQLTEGLRCNGYILFGRHYILGDTYIPDILNLSNPKIVFIQDRREWDIKPGTYRDAEERFVNVGALRDRSDIFKVTVVKDAHHNPPFHQEAAQMMGIHAWVHYYNARIVCRLNPWIRPEHLIRTYHTVNPKDVPQYIKKERKSVVLSGAVRPTYIYPLRNKIRYWNSTTWGHKVDFLHHPGYKRSGCYTPSYLKALSDYKVSICTSSIYGYTLRKIIESTACGCKVLTDLPEDEILPLIDDNLTRIHPDASEEDILDALLEMIETYDDRAQEELAQLTTEYYSYETQGKYLAASIEAMRQNYTLINTTLLSKGT